MKRARPSGPPGRVAPTRPIGESVATPVDHSGDVLQETQNFRRARAAWRRLLREEEGVALVLAMLTMVVLAMSLTAVIFLTSAAARDAHRSNAGQKAAALAESGINNALAVLNRELPAERRSTRATRTCCPPRRPTCAYRNGTVTWYGKRSRPVPANPTTPWKYEWRLTATRHGANPTGPAASAVSRTATAIVPVVIPTDVVASSGTTAAELGLRASTTSHSTSRCTSRRRVYATARPDPWNTATIAETIPASLPARASEQGRGRPRPVRSKNPQNQVGHVNGVGVPATTWRDPCRPLRARRRDNDTHLHPACWWDTDKRLGRHARQRHPAGPTSPHPKLTCCTSHRLDVAAGQPASAPPTPSYMGFWYQNADLGPNSPCATSSGTPPKFDTAAEPGQLDQRERGTDAPFDLTGATYSCNRRRPDEAGVGRGTQRSRSRARLHRRQRDRAPPDGRDVRRQGDDHPLGHFAMDEQRRAVREPAQARRLHHDRAMGSEHDRPRRSSRTARRHCAAGP